MRPNSMSRPIRIVLATSLAGLVAAGAGVRTAGQAARPERALLDRYCVTCHNDRLKTGGLTLEKVDVSDLQASAPVLEIVVRKLRSGQMPPPGIPRPDAATLAAFVSTVEAALDNAAAVNPDPGRIASRRLNRTEYINVIHDLLALDVNGAELLPSDPAAFGFDNNADSLVITPGLMARYMSAATKISRAALASPDNRPITSTYRIPSRVNQQTRIGEEAPFATFGGLAVRHTFPLNGEYVFKLLLKRGGGSGTIVGIEEEERQIEMRVDHSLIRRFRIGGKVKGLDSGTMIAIAEDDIEGQRIHQYRMTADDELEVRVPIAAGTRMVTATFTDSLPSALESGSGIGIDILRISGPFTGTVPDDTPSRRRILICRPTGSQDEEVCARKIMSTLARRAFRRPVTEGDVTPLVDIFRQGRQLRDFDAGIELAVEALLSSPSFLIRVESEPPDGRAGTAYQLSDMELASRLSFFIWRSMPDDELMELAVRGTLKHPDVLVQQVRRMLADRRATRFMNDFVEQWLEIRNIYTHEPDERLFPGFDPRLGEAMAQETKLFFESQVRQDRPIQELLTANYTYLNERLAQHYGIHDIYGSHFRRITLNDERRHGLLGQGSVLTVTSYANRTSVVLRGKWVLENLLGSPPPPPPPNVPPLKENDGVSKPVSLRERMEQHRRNPACATCHLRMDPLGFALENFDAVGKWRDTDSGAPINSAIELQGREINSPKAFRETLLTDSDAIVRTVTEKLLTFALGRGLESYDAPHVRQLIRNLARNEYRWSTLVLGIVQSVPFQMRRAGSSQEGSGHVH
jgi:hypothetical protein